MTCGQYTIQSITPTARRELLEFWTAIMKPMPKRLLPFWADGTETMDLYGYVEIGGCNGEIEETSLAFLSPNTIQPVHRSNSVRRSRRRCFNSRRRNKINDV